MQEKDAGSEDSLSLYNLWLGKSLGIYSLVLLPLSVWIPRHQAGEWKILRYHKEANQ